MADQNNTIKKINTQIMKPMFLNSTPSLL